MKAHKYMRRMMPLFFLLFVTLASEAFGGAMTVQVRNGAVRTRASAFGRVVGELPYGTRVQASVERSGWFRITDPAGLTGWMHGSALTQKRLVLRSGGAGTPGSATADELALAGKGFSPEVEREFRQRNASVDFRWIDRMEAYVVSEKEMLRFLEDGGIKPGSAGAGR